MTPTPRPTAPELKTPAAIKVHVLPSLEAVGAERWNELWSRAEAPTVFARYEWAIAWWRTFGANRTTGIYTAKLGDRLVGILPVVWPAQPSEPAVLIGDWHADYAAIITDRDAPEAFSAMLRVACADIPPGGRLVLAEVRNDTSYTSRLEVLAKGAGSRCVRTETVPCPRTGLEPEHLLRVLKKDSLKRHSRKLRQLGTVQVIHTRTAAEVLPRLEAFFEQHVARWAGTPTPSLFSATEHREFYREVCQELGACGLMVFTEIVLDGRPAAFHFGFLSEDDLVWYKPSFDPTLWRHSPGEVLLRELFLWAGEQGLAGVDFTRGGEAFKQRFATEQRFAATYICFADRLAAARVRYKLQLKRLAKQHLPGSLLRATRTWIGRRSRLKVLQ